MARPLRLEYPGAIYHVTARGNERRAIFRSATDRGRFLAKLAELKEIHHIEVYAFVQMANHYHLVICTPRGNLSAFMQQLQTSYTVYFNRRHDRVGHLFAGRYKAKLVEGGHYLMRLTRYVHLNPVKSTRVRDLPLADSRDLLRGYRWSSFPGYSGLSLPLEWVTYRALDAFGEAQTETDARREYLRFVERGLAQDDPAFLETLTHSSKALGSEMFCRIAEDRFKEQVAGLHRFIDVSRRRPESPVPVSAATTAVLAAYAIEEAELLRRGNREPKDVWMRLLHEACGLTQRQIGTLFGHTDGATVSRRLSQITSPSPANTDAGRAYEALRAAITNSKA